MKQLANLLIIILILSISPGCTPAPIPELAPTISLPTQTPSSSAPVQPAAQTPVKTSPAVRQNAAEALWISNTEDQTVLRIDPHKNDIAATIQIDGRPDEVTTGEGWVWALDRRQSRIYRIDPRQNRVTAEFQLPDGDAKTVRTGNGSVWVGMTEAIDLVSQVPSMDEEFIPSGVVLQIEPNNGEITRRWPAQPVSQLQVDGSALWVLSNTVVDTTLQVFDLSSGQGMVVPFQNSPNWLPLDAIEISPQAMWLYSAAYGKIFQAGLDGRIRSAISLEERQPVGHADLLLTESGLWAITTWGSVLHIDPNTNHILGKIELNAPLTRLLSTPGAVWVLSEQTAMLFRIDPQQHAIAAQIATGSLLLPTVVPTPTPRVVLWKPCADAPTSRLKVGDIAYVTKDPPLPNRVRQKPNREAEILGLINPGGGMDIIDGPSCGEGWVWWKVKNADLEGWTPEGDFETYWLIPLYD